MVSNWRITSKIRGLAMSSISFIRHGQASFGKRDYDDLSDIGKRQSEILGGYLADTGSSFDVAYSGEMKRHEQTADEVISVYKDRGLAFPDMRIISDLNEFDFQSLFDILLPGIIKDNPSLKNDMPLLFKDRKIFDRVIKMIISRWLSGEYDLGEHEWSLFIKRVRNGFNRIIEENGANKNIIVFSSGGPISAIIQAALDISDEKTALLTWHIYNASITRIYYKGENVALSSFNNIPHLELERRKELITFR